EPRLLAHARHRAGVLLELVANVRRSAALPHDREVDRAARRALPDDRRLALVRDADGRDVLGAQPRRAERAGDARLDARPYLAYVVRHPARLREVLRKLGRGAPERAAAAFATELENERRRPRRPLVDREDVLGHEWGEDSGMGRGAS